MRGMRGLLVAFAVVGAAALLDLSFAPARNVAVFVGTFVAAIIIAITIARSHEPPAPALSFWLTGLAVLVGSMVGLAVLASRDSVVDGSVLASLYVLLFAIPCALLAGTLAAVLSLRRRNSTP